MQGIYRKLAQSPGSSLTALGVVLSVATIVLFLTDLQARYRDRIATAKTDAQSFATILAEHTALTFEDVDRVLRRAEVIRSTSLSGKLADPGLANAALRQLQKSSSVIVALGWTRPGRRNSNEKERRLIVAAFNPQGFLPAYSGRRP
jgi:hypothetical protein